jgi:hypothetical protein
MRTPAGEGNASTSASTHALQSFAHSTRASRSVCAVQFPIGDYLGQHDCARRAAVGFKEYVNELRSLRSKKPNTGLKGVNERGRKYEARNTPYPVRNHLLCAFRKVLARSVAAKSVLCARPVCTHATCWHVRLKGTQALQCEWHADKCLWRTCLHASATWGINTTQTEQAESHANASSNPAEMCQRYSSRIMCACDMRRAPVQSFGTYDTTEAAAQAYDIGYILFRGASGKINRPIDTYIDQATGRFRDVIEIPEQVCAHRPLTESS